MKALNAFFLFEGLFLIVVSKDPPEFPEIPVEVLALLGISGGSYSVSKGIQTSRDIGLKRAKKDTEASSSETMARTIIEKKDE